MKAKENPVTAPLNLWLQWHGDGDPDDCAEVSEEEVTWCQEKIFDLDIRYVRADQVNVLLQALNNLIIPCTRADYTVGKLDDVVCDIAQKALDKYKQNVKL